MTTWNGATRVCATCRYWQGKRDIDLLGNFYRAIDTSGRCSNPQGAFRRLEMNEGASCQGWQRHV